MQREFLFTPSKEQKENLKLRANQIKQQRNLFKSCQREKSKFELNNTYWHWKGVNHDQWLELDSRQLNKMKDLAIMRDEYRIRHIAYSMGLTWREE